VGNAKNYWPILGNLAILANTKYWPIILTVGLFKSPLRKVGKVDIARPSRVASGMIVEGWCNIGGFHYFSATTQQLPLRSRHPA